MNKPPKEFYQDFKQNPKNLFLISYRRTGCHYLMYLLWEYYHKTILLDSKEILDGLPMLESLTQKDCLLMHSHDDGLKLKPKNVIILKREPVVTIFSNLVMLNRKNKRPVYTFTEEQVRNQAESYRKFYYHWNNYSGNNVFRFKSGNNHKLTCESFLRTIIFIDKLFLYENNTDCLKISRITLKVTKEYTANMTKNKPLVSSNIAGYDDERKKFIDNYSPIILDQISGRL